MTLTATGRPAIFLDRDGVIIENRDAYVRGRSDVKFYPSALRALASVATTELAVVIITNQSAVGRGILSLERATAINDQVVRIIVENGGRVDATYMCPHDPAEHCACRKPEPGLLLQAIHDLELDPQRSCMIGDALSDIRAGRAAGVGANFLVRTGRGQQQVATATAADLDSFTAVDNLATAIERFTGVAIAGDVGKFSGTITKLQLEQESSMQSAGKD